MPITVFSANVAVILRAERVRKEYASVARECDRLFAPTVPPVNGPGPFSAALKSFVSGNVVPVIFGAFAEFNTKTMDDIVATLAVLGASTDSGQALAPHDRRGPFQILKRKYRQALGVMASRVNADLKLHRLRFIQPSAERAKACVAAQRAHFSNQGYQHNAPPWFSSQYHDPFRSFDEWRASQRRDDSPFL